ncbi:carboxymuconolactone decarboxylase family protein [Alcaligenes sp. 13f]|uniref:carboxymuconolactone decarboxylase family protein n=1 Tax=Alcaligenes sp. 13f TaxID=2841924 RepID=UPI001CF64BD5|nr:carboxymuconolactone decarboxylase family protein [Alcaligenes sp. 13f]MCB4321562.1 carboxymuconolactone decarboxylase family protein [Alcaligenes sp. 13f]
MENYNKNQVKISTENINSNYLNYKNKTIESAENVLGIKISTLLRLAIAVAIPNKNLAMSIRKEALNIADEQEVKEAELISAALRAGAAVAYGRLVFKFIEGNSEFISENIIEQIKEDRKYMTNMRNTDAESFDLMAKYMSSLHGKGMRINPKDYELIAIACATITQCAYCLQKHTADAIKAGATKIEMAAAIHLAIGMRVEASLEDLI